MVRPIVGRPERAMSPATTELSTPPDIATMERSIAKRGGRLYLDVMQNSLGKHVVPPYVLRATPLARDARHW